MRRQSRVECSEVVTIILGMFATFEYAGEDLPFSNFLRITLLMTGGEDDQ